MSHRLNLGANVWVVIEMVRDLDDSRLMRME